MMYLKDLGNGKHSVRCPWEDQHTSGESGDGSTVIFEAANGRPAGFKCQHSHCASRATKDVYEFFGTEAMATFVPQSAGTRDSHFSFQLLKDLFEEPEEATRWVVDGLLPTGGTSVLAAKAKTGKTTLCGSLAISVSRGESFLDRVTSKGAVLHLAVEEKKSEVIRRYREQGATGEEQIYIHASAAPQDAIGLLEQVIHDLKPVLVIVDTLFRVVPVENGNDYSEVTRALEPIQNLARKLGVHIMLVHHLGKSERDGGDGILGSTAIQGAVDTLIILNRTAQHRTIKTIQRYGVDIEESILSFDPDTKTNTLGSTKNENSKSQLSQRIMSYLKSQTDAVEGSEICEQVGGKRDSVLKMLHELHGRGELIRSGTGRRNSPFVFCLNFNRSEEIC